jgi:hypothetical protein
MGHASAAPTIERIEAVFPVDQGQPSLMLRLPNTKCIGGDGEVAALCGEYREPLFWSMFLFLNRLNAAWDEIQREGAAVYSGVNYPLVTKVCSSRSPFSITHGTMHPT